MVCKLVAIQKHAVNFLFECGWIEVARLDDVRQLTIYVHLVELLDDLHVEFRNLDLLPRHVDKTLFILRLVV